MHHIIATPENDGFGRWEMGGFLLQGEICDFGSEKWRFGTFFVLVILVHSLKKGHFELVLRGFCLKEELNDFG